MNNKHRILGTVAVPKGGIFLPHLKASAETETVIMPPANEIRIPLQQHVGTPARLAVKKDDEVFVGTVIAKSSGLFSVPVHSSVSGIVKDIVKNDAGKCVIIESDGKMAPDPSLKPFNVKKTADLAAAANACGLVGLGGAGIPTKVKLTPPKNTKIDTLIINAAECEPYITSDYRECLENPEDIISGIYLIKDTLKIENAIVCIENDKKSVFKKLFGVANAGRDGENIIKFMGLPKRYPSGAEKVLIYAATGRKMPVGKLPSDVGCIVMNITSIATLYRFISTGMPLVAKRVTVDGTAVSVPKNVLVPIGTQIKDLLNFVGGIDEEANEIIIGGPMMGENISSAEAVIDKRCNAITVMKLGKKKPQSACIHCGRCAASCPMKLYPSMIEAALNTNALEKLANLNVDYCIECGCCSFVCPAAHSLTESMRLAKEEVKIKEEGK